ncbi:unnamed protein product [Phytophthora fragariaefolia]|uniref:Unnamed protein product n=1 Tax=Phytophthora fragariaefolia TaxID=1490495 RepID=A0A9W6Y2Q5_9STRA|nr:unnamed protein product [Phytophthora fragariaefolia]
MLVSSMVPRADAPGSVSRERLPRAESRREDADRVSLARQHAGVRPVTAAPLADSALPEAAPPPASSRRRLAPEQASGPPSGLPATSSKSSGAATPRSTGTVQNEGASEPFVIEDPENNEEEGGDTPNDQKKLKKRVRYLRDTERRNIIKRIESGEKQAALAREFGVTRAAICHIKKNRVEILSRFNMLVKSAQEMYELVAGIAGRCAALG